MAVPSAFLMRLVPFIDDGELRAAFAAIDHSPFVRDRGRGRPARPADNQSARVHREIEQEFVAPSRGDRRARQLADEVLGQGAGRISAFPAATFGGRSCGEQCIAELGTKFAEAGDRRTKSASTRIFR
jgi:hypothetical protein